MRRLALVVAAVLIAGIAVLVGSTTGQQASGSGSACSKDTSGPSSGTFSLAFLRASTENFDRNDYRLSGTLQWDSQEAVACFASGIRDWAYEHDVVYASHFDRKIWNVSFGNIPDDAQPYIDTTVSDSGDVTTLGFGIFRPDKLKAGVAYTFSYELMLPNDPAGGRQPLSLEWEVLSRDCSKAGPWCVGLNTLEHRGRGTLVGSQRGFDVQGQTCWRWTNGSDPLDCSPVTPSPQSSAPSVAESSPAPAAEPAPAPEPAAAPEPAPAAEPAPAPEPAAAPEPAPAAEPAPAPEPAPTVAGPHEFFSNYGAAVEGIPMCRGNAGRPESMPGGTVLQAFTADTSGTINSATVQIDPDVTVTATAVLTVDGVDGAPVSQTASGDVTFSFSPTLVRLGSTVQLRITFTATSGKIITIYRAGGPGGTFSVSNACPDGAPSLTRSDSGIRATVGGIA